MGVGGASDTAPSPIQIAGRVWALLLPRLGVDGASADGCDTAPSLHPDGGSGVGAASAQVSLRTLTGHPVLLGWAERIFMGGGWGHPGSYQGRGRTLV